MLEAFLWILVGIVIYTYLGYTVILFVCTLFKRNKIDSYTDSDLPEITHVIAAYNEKDIIADKLANSKALDYPEKKLKHIWVTDGSNDGSEKLLQNNRNLVVLHSNERKGKTAALNRAMEHVSTPITVFSDANTMLSENSMKKLAAPFIQWTNVGCVAGEKRIVSYKKDKASGAGEGHYWNYESTIKKLESKFGSTMGAVGELYAIRTELFTPPKENTILDDFVVSMDIVQKGNKIYYESNALATEKSSFNIDEELKRKVRIAAGGFQVLADQPQLLNFFKHPKLSFQFFSHKVLRWAVVPLALIFILVLNSLITLQNRTFDFYFVLLCAQLLFYSFGVLGYLFRNRAIRLKILFIPYYLTIMNFAQIGGLIRYIGGNQKAVWEKAKRNI